MIVWRRTTPEAAALVVATGRWESRERGDLFFSNRLDGQAVGYGSTAMAVDIPEHLLALDDEFPDGEQHFRIPATAVDPRWIVNRSDMEAPRMNVTRGKNADYVQAWEFSREGSLGGYVYDQQIALDRLGEGYDIQAVTIVRHATGAREYLKGTLAANVAAYREDPTNAVAFHAEHGSVAYDPDTEAMESALVRSAVRAAEAERYAAAQGWTVEWTPDLDASADGDVEPTVREQAVLYSADGEHLTSLGSIADATPDYRRVVEADLALEARAMLAERFMSENLADHWVDAQHRPHALPSQALEYAALSPLRTAVTASGNHFFERDAMRFHDSRVLPTLIDNRFFITRDSTAIDNSEHAYRVRWVSAPAAHGNLQVNRFDQDFTSAGEAQDFARQAAATIPKAGLGPHAGVPQQAPPACKTEQRARLFPPPVQPGVAAGRSM